MLRLILLAYRRYCHSSLCGEQWGGLAALTTSFFARLEKVEALHHELSEGEDRELNRRFAAEEAMLKQVLEWLEIHPGGGAK